MCSLERQGSNLVASPNSRRSAGKTDNIIRMTQPNHPSADCAEFYDVRALTAVETATTVRQSVALRIAELYPRPAIYRQRLALCSLDWTSRPILNDDVASRRRVIGRRVLQNLGGIEISRVIFFLIIIFIRYSSRSAFSRTFISRRRQRPIFHLPWRGEVAAHLRGGGGENIALESFVTPPRAWRRDPPPGEGEGMILVLTRPALSSSLLPAGEGGEIERSEIEPGEGLETKPLAPARAHASLRSGTSQGERWKRAGA